MPERRRALLPLALLLTFTAVTSAQERKPPPSVGEDPQQTEKTGGLSKKDHEAGLEEGGDSGAGSNTRRARGYCEFHCGVSPKRVAPGMSGTLTVTMALVGDMVLPSPPPVTFDVRHEQGKLVVGDPAFRPAKTAFLAPAFRGQVAYDNCAIFEVPFTVLPDAVHGQHAISVGLAFELFDGRTGQSVGTFSDRAGTRVPVGEPLPVYSPPSRRGPDTLTAEGGTDAPAKTLPVGPAAPPPGQDTGPEAAGAAEPKPVAGPIDDAGAWPVGSAGPPEADEDGGLLLLIGLGAGIAILGLILTMARRRR